MSLYLSPSTRAMTETAYTSLPSSEGNGHANANAASTTNAEGEQQVLLAKEGGERIHRVNGYIG